MSAADTLSCAPAAGSTYELSWYPSGHARRLLTLVALLLGLGLALGRIDLAALAAVPLAPLALAAWRRPPGCVDVRVTTASDRCFEDEPIETTVTVGVDGPVDVLSAALRSAAGMPVTDGCPHVTRIATRAADLACTVRPVRWGRRAVGGVDVELYAVGRLAVSRLSVRADRTVAVFPQPAPIGRLVVPAGRTDRSGDHTGRQPGPGLQFGGIRPYGPGDPARRINWAVSTRRRALHVNETTAERAVDVVVAVDVFDDVGAAGDSSLDRTMRGATGVVRHFLASHDRVGLVAVGGWLRWLAPTSGDLQFYRVADTILDVLGQRSFIDPDLSRVPRVALPPGAIVVYFSPLLDRRAVDVATDLRARRHALTVVDVLASEPDAHPKREPELLARRLWRLDRSVLRSDLELSGIAVVEWDGAEPLDALLQPGLRRLAERQR